MKNLLIVLTVVLSLLIPSVNASARQPLDAYNREVLAEQAFNASKTFFGGLPYDWNEGRYCSTLSSNYAENLGLTISYTQSSEGMPWAGTVAQTKWIESHYAAPYFFKLDLKELVSKSVWRSVPVGSLVYLPTAISHNGYDQYSHVVIFMGWEKQEPIFAEYSAIMKNGPQDGRTLTDIMEPYLTPGGYDFSPYSPGQVLKVLVFDIIGVTHPSRHYPTYRIQQSVKPEI
jgi:hypothetical protein